MKKFSCSDYYSLGPNGPRVADNVTFLTCPVAYAFLHIDVAINLMHYALNFIIPSCSFSEITYKTLTPVWWILKALMYGVNPEN